MNVMHISMSVACDPEDVAYMMVAWVVKLETW